MTDRKPEKDREGAARLREALAASDTLSCADAQALLPELVAAELAGVDVDADPTFAALLQHLDHCDDCLALYEELSEGIAALDPAEAQAPVPAPTNVPRFFPPSVPTGMQRLLEGLKRGFRLDIPLPQPLPLVGTLGSKPQVTIFSETLSEVADAPNLSISLQAQGTGFAVRMAIDEKEPSSRWQVTIQAGSFASSAFTDEGGTVTFERVPLKDIEQLELICIEDTEANNEA